jgi:hypothetical protein
VRTKFRGLGSTWLDEDASGSPLSVSIRVPSDAGSDRGQEKEYKYEIHVESVGVLDPRIVIQ